MKIKENAEKVAQEVFERKKEALKRHYRPGFDHDNIDDFREEITQLGRKYPYCLVSEIFLQCRSVEDAVEAVNSHVN